MTYKERVVKELMSMSCWRDLLAEGFATFVLVAIQCALPLTFGKNPAASLLETALGMGFVVVLLIESFGHYGGAHMNPAVTVSMLVCNKITITRAFFYIIFQCGFAIGGAALIYRVTPEHRRESLAATTLNPELSPWQGVLVEGFLTFIIASTVHGATNGDRHKVFMPSIPIGLSVATAILAGANHTGASMNCARSLGPAVIMNIWEHHWIYWVGPILGGIAAGIFHHYMLDRVGKANQSESTSVIDDIPESMDHDTYPLTDAKGNSANGTANTTF